MISKVKGHADESLVRSGQVRALDRYGNTRADEAADFGRRRVWPEVADPRRNLSGVCRRWYPVVLVLHRFFIAISRAVMTLLVWPLTLLFGLLGAILKDVALLMSLRMLLCFRVLLISGILVGLVFLLLLSLLRISVFGRTLLGSWSSWLPSWVLFFGPLLVLTWVLGKFPGCSSLHEG